MLRFFVHLYQRCAFHDLDVVLDFAVALGREVHSIELVVEDVVVQSGWAAGADAPLGAEGGEQVERFQVVRPDFDLIQLVIFWRETGTDQLFLGRQSRVQRCGGGDQFFVRCPELASSVIYTSIMARALPM